MKDNTKLIAVIAVLLAAFLLLTHPQEANNIPFLTVSGGGASIDIGDYHYRSEGVYPQASQTAKTAQEVQENENQG